MDHNIINSFFLATGFLALFATAELLYHQFNMKAEHSRKLVHITSGLMTLSFPILLTDHWYVLALCTSFALILISSQRFNLLKSINAIDRISRGSILFPAVIYGAYLTQDHFSNLLFFYVPVLILALCDPIACLAGKKWPKGKYTLFKETKTAVGSAAFFISAMGITIPLLMHFTEGSLLTIIYNAALIASGTTVAEGVSQKGYDNLFIPLTAILILSFLDFTPLLFALL